MRVPRPFALSLAVLALLLARPLTGYPAPAKAPRVLRVGVGRSNPPFSYIEGGQPVGYWVDLARETAAALGYEVDVRAGVWDDVKGELREGRIDVAAAMADIPERRAFFAFTVPVSTYAYALWVRGDTPVRSPADLAGARIVLQRGSAAADGIAALAPGAVVALVPEDADALLLLASGRYDAALLPMAQGAYYARALKLRSLRSLPGAVLTADQCFAVAKGDEALARELDLGFSVLKSSGRADELYRKWMGLRERTILDRAPAWLLAFLAAATSLFLLSLGFVLVLRSAVRRRTEALAANERKYRALVESLPQMIFVKDRSSTYLSCNRRYAEALGIEPGEIAGKDDYDFYPRETADKYRADDRAAMELSGQLEIIELWPGPDGDAWIDTVKVAIRGEDGAVSGVVGVFRDVSERLRLEEDLRRSLGEKEILLREVNHRVKNNLQLINAIIRLELGEGSSAELSGFVKDTAARISSIAAVHELLYSSDDVAEIRVADYLKHVSRGLLDTYTRSDRCVEIVVEAESLSLDLSRMVSLGLMANEMITNSLKYAFEGRDRGRIGMSMSKDADCFLFRYEDDGVGLSPGGGEKGRRSLGMTFINSLARQLDGRVSMRNEGGLAYELRFGDGCAKRCADKG